MVDCYRKCKLASELTPEELKFAKENQFDFDENALGAFIICDPIRYTEVPKNCKPDTFPVSFRNDDYRADAVCDGFINEKREAYISEHEMDIGICMEWPI